MRLFANLLILLTDTVSANFIAQNAAPKVSVHFSSARANTSEIICLTWLTLCQQEADKLSAGRMTDTLSLFRECLVRAVSRGASERRKAPAASHAVVTMRANTRDRLGWGHPKAEVAR